MFYAISKWNIYIYIYAHDVVYYTIMTSQVNVVVVSTFLFIYLFV